MLPQIAPGPGRSERPGPEAADGLRGAAALVESAVAGLSRHPDTGEAILGGFPLKRIFQTERNPGPVYAYDLDAVESGARALSEALGSRGLLAYAVKANSAGSIVRRIASAGGGADVVSGAELALAHRAGVKPANIVMSGVGKTDQEIDAALALGIRALQVESLEELCRVESRAAAASRTARVSVRINPGVQIDSHAHIATGHDDAKFGVTRDAWSRVAELSRSSARLELTGVSTHVGSMLREVAPYLTSAGVVCDLARDWLARGLPLSFVDFGGGFGIDDGNGPVPPSPVDFARAARELIRERGLDHLQLVVEPGRSMVGPHGVLVSRVVQSKQTHAHRWLIVDAGMNDMIRTALYGARHRIEPLGRPPGGPPWRVVGPVCESSCDFGTHALGSTAPDAVVVRDVGAYGFTLASEYNGRALPAEVFISGGQIVSESASPGAEAWIERRLRA